VRQHWRDPAKSVLLVALVIGGAVGGYLAARSLTSEFEKALAVTTNLVTVVRTTDGKVQTVVETQVETQTKTRVSTETGDTRLVTVVRGGKAVVLRVPGKTVTVTDTVRLPGKTKVVTKTQTNTVDRPTTTTERSTTTHTETVTGPQRTFTETETETVTETVTVTETEKPGKPTPP
jgi:hypothetical protein